MQRTTVTLVVALALGATGAVGCGGNDGGGDDGLEGHVNEEAVQNCIEEGNDEETCREIWTVK